MKLEHLDVVVSGRVQGVGFRFAAQRTARTLKLQGWVKNLYNGDVEILAEGPAEAITALVDWCHEGPSAAEVTQVKIKKRIPIERSNCSGFEVRYED